MKPNVLQRASAAWGAMWRGARMGWSYSGSATPNTGPLSLWRAHLQSPDREWLPERNTVVARARDLSRNAPIINAAVRRRVNSAVGVGWRLSARVDPVRLGIEQTEAATLNRAIEAAWRDFVAAPRYEIDAQRSLTFTGLLRTAVRTWFVDGEALAVLEWRPDPLATYATRVNMIDPDRLSNPNGQADSMTLRGGVELDEAGAPIAYWIREAHPTDPTFASANWKRIPRWTSWGRPQVLHVFDRERAGQNRGVTQLVAVLKAMKSLDRYTEATIEAAVINAMVLGFVKSGGGPGAVSDSFQPSDALEFEAAREKIYGGRSVALAEGPVLPVMPHGDEIELLTSQRDVGQFENFSRSFMRFVASACGATYEEVSMDYSTTNYSSIRAAMIPAYAETRFLQQLIEDQFVNPIYAAWLEEAVEMGHIDIPAGALPFDQARDAWRRCRWISPGKGFIDDTKEIAASEAKVGAFLSTREDEAAETGRDWEEIAEQQKRELEKLAELGIAPETGPKLTAAPEPVTVDSKTGEKVSPEDQRPQPAAA